MARWETDFDRLDSGEWWHVIKDQPEELAALSANTRSKVRRGEKRFFAAQEHRNDVVQEGYAVYRAAYRRYSTFEPMLPERDFVKAVCRMPPETEFWGVRERETGLLVAFSENIVRDGACFYNTIWFDPEALQTYAGYVLIHAMNKHYLNERGLRYVSDGSRNISHQTGVHGFLQEKFGFRRAYARLRVTYLPMFGLAVRLLYTFRRRVAGSDSVLAKKVTVVLEQERIRRACIPEPDQTTSTEKGH